MFEAWFPYLDIKIKNLPKIAFNLFGLEIYWYGIIIVCSIFIALYVIKNECNKHKQNFEIYSDCLFYTLIFSIIGARLYYVLFSFEEYKNNLLSIFAIREGGIAIYGGILTGILVIIIYTKIKKLNVWIFGDISVLGLVLAQSIGRWGNFFNREAYGTYTNNLFSLRYLSNQAFSKDENILKNIFTYQNYEYIQVHPTFLYESIFNLMLFIFLMIFKKNKKFNGQITLIYFLCYSFARFFIESLRTDKLIFFGTNIAASQIVSIIIFVVSLILLNLKNNQNNKIKELNK